MRTVAWYAACKPISDDSGQLVRLFVTIRWVALKGSTMEIRPVLGSMECLGSTEVCPGCMLSKTSTQGCHGVIKLRSKFCG